MKKKKNKRREQNNEQKKQPVSKTDNTIVHAGGTLSYESLFIRTTPLTGRQCKTTYLRKEFFDRIQLIINLYGNSGLSVFAYIDAVLEQHFEIYRQQIKEIHDKLYRVPYDE